MLARGVRGMFRHDERATLGRIGVPVLVVTGDRDRVLVPQVSARMRDALPQAELVVLRPAGHMGNWEQHPRFVEAVAAFSARCLAAPAPGADGTLGPGAQRGSAARGPDRLHLERSARPLCPLPARVYGIMSSTKLPHEGEHTQARGPPGGRSDSCKVTSPPPGAAPLAEFRHLRVTCTFREICTLRRRRPESAGGLVGPASGAVEGGLVLGSVSSAAGGDSTAPHRRSVSGDWCGGDRARAPGTPSAERPRTARRARRSCALRPDGAAPGGPAAGR